MRLILIRHCKTLFNVSGHIMGWGDSPRARNWLDDLVYIEAVLQQRNTCPDQVCSSALGRARHTADYFADKLNLDDSWYSERLNEIDYGTLTEKSKKWVAANYPLHKKDPDFVYPGGESFRQMQRRCVACVEELALRQHSATILCVVHAGVIRGLVSHFLQLDFTSQLKRRVSHRYIGVLDFSGISCTAYDEWGEPSGFLTDEVITLPHACA